MFHSLLPLDLKEPSERSIQYDDMNGFHTPPPSQTYYQRKHSLLEPLDIYNSDYIEYLADKEFFGKQQDFIEENIVSIFKRMSEVSEKTN